MKSPVKSASPPKPTLNSVKEQVDLLEATTEKRLETLEQMVASIAEMPKASEVFEPPWVREGSASALTRDEMAAQVGELVAQETQARAVLLGEVHRVEGEANRKAENLQAALAELNQDLRARLDKLMETGNQSTTRIRDNVDGLSKQLVEMNQRLSNRMADLERLNEEEEEEKVGDEEEDEDGEFEEEGEPQPPEPRTRVSRFTARAAANSEPRSLPPWVRIRQAAVAGVVSRRRRRGSPSEGRERSPRSGSAWYARS